MVPQALLLLSPLLLTSLPPSRACPEAVDGRRGEPAPEVSASRNPWHQLSRSTGKHADQPKHVLPMNKKVSAFLHGGRFKRFLYPQGRRDSPVSLVVTPCSADLRGAIIFYPDTISDGGNQVRIVHQILGPKQVIYSERRGEPGNYDINITASTDTYVHFLATDEDLADLGALRRKVIAKTKSRGRAEISWLPASYGGQALHYCLITSPEAHFSTVCGALSTKFGIQAPESVAARRRRAQVEPRSHRERRLRAETRNITVGCVGRDTIYTLHELQAGTEYHVTVFGQYLKRGVSFQYGVTTFSYSEPTEGSLTIKQNRVTRLHLTPARRSRQLTLHRRHATRALYYYVISCGGPLRLRVLGGQPPKELDTAVVTEMGFFSGGREKLSYNNYQFEFEATGSATRVECLVTWRLGKLGLASRPNRLRLKLVGERRLSAMNLTCGQMALAMSRSRGRDLEYCVLLEPDLSGHQGRRFKLPSVCGLDTRLKLNPTNLTQCGAGRHLRRGKRVELVFSHLPPGQTYVARAMVRRKGGRFLPYRLSQVTVPPCPNQLTNDVTERSNVIPSQLVGELEDAEWVEPTLATPNEMAENEDMMNNV